MRKLLLLASLCFIASISYSQDKDKSLKSESNLKAFKWRSIGPAFASGRIADIALHPTHDHTWYVAVGSGGVWKTTNAGTTWKSIFDGQSVYSTGCITIDPHNHHKIWLGTGENVGGRHVAWGDGIYVSEDGGTTWKNMGLKESQHISEIIVHPTDPNTVWVAAQGPLWNSGGERGFYMTVDGGQTWSRTLGDDEWTGVTDIAVDPRNPDIIYAATWQRHRTVAAYMGGGPLSGIWKSMDGGENWSQLKTGLPSGNVGKIGLAISPQKPDILYAAIELNRTKGGVYKSTNQGASWTKQSDAVSGATGPHYYQELYASPHEFDKLYLMDVRVQVSSDGGKNFQRMKEQDKHSDNHAIVFREDDPDYVMIGTDAGIYESFDNTDNWRFIANLPLTQYYKVAVDDQEPFYWVYGGTQDNGSHSGPSRTVESEGIRNAHWYKTLGADGHQTATEPGNPDIFYAETQQGGLHRIDRLTGEQIFIQPQAGPGEDFERFNWDAPIVVSPHDPATLYFASQRVWRSDNRGDSWTAISDDLTKDEVRLSLPIMGRTQSWDSPWDVGAMSNYNTVTSLSESPVEKGLVYAGTDDGILQVTEDGGSTWRKYLVGNMPGVPATAFVNDIRADLHDANTVYICLDNHKYGDFSPYLLKSSDRGRTWIKASSGFPEKMLIWRTVQDHVNKNLMFAATEYGVYVSFDGANNWMKFGGGFPTISVRDITIQRRENDLVAATFGRGFYILDDYSALRGMDDKAMASTAHLYPIKDTWQYNQRGLIGNQGAGMYMAKNPAYGATFTYHINEELTSVGAARKKQEKKLNKDNASIPWPGWDGLLEESQEEKPSLSVVIRDASGDIVKRIKAPYKKGIHRVTWDLSTESKRGIRLEGRDGPTPWWLRGSQVVPGSYTATLMKDADGLMISLGEPQQFNIKSMIDGALPQQDVNMIAAYRSEVEEFRGAMSSLTGHMSTSENKVKAMKKALMRSSNTDADLTASLHAISQELRALRLRMSGDPNKNEIGERNNPTLNSFFGVARRGTMNNYGPTDMHKTYFDHAKNEYSSISKSLSKIVSDIDGLEEKLIKMGAPYIEGQPLRVIGEE